MNLLSWFSFYSLLLLPVLALQNITLGFGDSGLVFFAGWKASNDQASANRFFRFDSVGTALIASLPTSTTLLRYVGLKRTGGSRYGVCVNCQQDDSSIMVIDGHDDGLRNNSDAVLTVLFQLRLDGNRHNTLTIFNLGDSRFEGESEITFDSLIITLDGSESSSISSSTATTSSTLTPSSISVSSSSTRTQTSTSSVTPSPSASASTASGNSTQSSAGTRTSIIAIIVVLSALGIASLIVGLFFYNRRQRIRRLSQMPRPPVDPNQRSFVPPSADAGSPSFNPIYAPKVPPVQPSPMGPLAAAGRSRPPTRLPHPNPYAASRPPTLGPIVPVRRSEIE